MKLKLDFTLPKLVKLRVGLQLGLDVGARIELKLRVRGGEPIRWKAALAPGGGRPELPEAQPLVIAPGREPPRA